MFNLHNKLIGESPDVYREPASIAVAVASIATSVGVGAVTGTMAADAQKKAAKEAAEKERLAQMEAMMAQRKIDQEVVPDQKAIEGIEFGTDTGLDGSISDFLVTKPKTPATGGMSGVSTTGTSGLGFQV